MVTLSDFNHQLEFIVDQVARRIMTKAGLISFLISQPISLLISREMANFKSGQVMEALPKP